MNLLANLKIFAVGVLLVFAGCADIKSESEDSRYFPVVTKLIAASAEPNQGIIFKEVMLNDSADAKHLTLDTAQWKKEFEFLADINPNKPELKGAFEIIEATGDKLSLKLKAEEKAPLKNFTYTKDGQTEHLKALLLEEKQLFSLKKSIQVTFEQGRIQSYEILGFQKILFKDTTFFKLRVSVNP